MSSSSAGRGGGSQARLSPRRLAEHATAHPRRVLGAWAVACLVSMGLVSALLATGLTGDGDVTSTPESKRAEQLIDARIAQDGIDEIVIVRSETAVVTDPAFRARVQSLAGAIGRSGDVERVRTFLDRGGEVLVSRDRHATVLPVVMRDIDAEDIDIDSVVAAVQRADGDDGFAVDITGEFTVGHDFERVSEEDLRKGELQFGLPAALVVLLLVFGTAVGAAIPLMMATVSIIVGLGIVAVLGQLWELNLFITNMLVAMGLALGIDYSLFIVSRLREERARGAGHREAILAVASTATRAVVFSGCAFAMALVGMLLVPDTVLRSLGLGAVVVALVSVTVALTFHPALLMVLGDRVERLRVPWLGRRVADTAGREGRFWGGLVRAVVRRPAVSLLAAVVLLLAAASPLLDLKLGSAGAASLPEGTVAKQGLLALERDFPAGATDPIDVVVDLPRDDPAVAAGVRRLGAQLAGDRDFAARATSVQARPDLTVLSVPLQPDPSSERATAAVDRLRAAYVPAAFGDAADRVHVGGGPAEARDYFALVGDWLPIVMVFVLSLSFVLLTLAFRSIVVPLTAIAVNLLSVAAAYGLLVLVFQQGVGADLLGFGEVERIEAWVPVFLFSVLFGLSMDYQVFLLSRIRERYTQTGDTTASIIHGVGSTARLITGAALIIVVVFAGFASGELVSFQQMGFGVAVALLVDATIVRSIVIPAAMELLGERNWYLPSSLSWLPRVAIEAAPGAGAAAPAPASEHLVIAERHDHDRTVLAVGGELDLRTSPELRSRIEAVDDRELVIDLRGLTFVDSSGLAVLVAAQRDARRAHRRLTLIRSPDTPIAQILNRSGLARELPLSDD